MFPTSSTDAFLQLTLCSVHHYVGTMKQEKFAFFQVASCKFFWFFYWGWQKTFLPFLYSNPTSDLIIAMSHSHVLVIHLDFRTHFQIFWQRTLCLIFSYLTSVHGNGLHDAVLSGRARGTIWRGYDDCWTVGLLQTGGRAHTGNVSLVEWPK